MDLNILWFVLIGVLYAGYFILEGFDFGVGILLPLISKDDSSRRIIINTIGPHWDGNEVWLIVAGGATFAAFPMWYATLFSGFYLPLFLLVIGLIFRGVAFEFRSKNDNPHWRKFWDWAIFIGSLLPSFIWGVAFANIIRGLPIDDKFNYTGGFLNLINPFAILGGILSVVIFIYLGSLFLILKTDGKLLEKIQKIAIQTWLPSFLLVLIVILVINFSSDYFDKNMNIPFILAVCALFSLGTSGILNRLKKDLPAFIFAGFTILILVSAIFSGLFPNVLPAQNGINNLTIYNAASGSNTLRTMSVIALILVPIVIAYQAYTYWIFKKRITIKKPSDIVNLEY